MRCKVVFNGKFKWMSCTEETELQRVIDFARALWKLDDPKKTYGAFYNGEPFVFGEKLKTFRDDEPRIEVREVNFKKFNPIGGGDADGYDPQKQIEKMRKLKPQKRVK